MAVTGAVRIAAAAACIVLFMFLAGFVVFASSIARRAGLATPQADGIVVLTGGQQRLSEAARLLAEGRGKRLLISGANRMATREDLHRKSGLTAQLFECCVDIGYDAHTTSGNAQETMAWARDKRFKRLIIVTSSYHMPRSLIELARVMPRVTLVPHPVVSSNFRPERWWLHAATMRLLFTEYVKFLPSAARFGMARLLQSWDGNALAGNGLTRASTS
ncbi:MAG TPA: YdcF family protein [Hyphomicrobiaceae bacterium]|nr:YdcF family protein [Hyphomicrobiaceae bacterium]